MPLSWMVELVREGVRNLVRHKLRSTLTLLGVVFGVAAVITMQAVGEGGQRSVLKEISGLGLNNIIVESVESTEANRPKDSDNARHSNAEIARYGLTFRDADQMKAVAPDVELILGHKVQWRVFFGNTRINAGVLGVPPSYYRVLNARLVDGRLPCDLDETFNRRVAVVSPLMAESLKKLGPAVGQKLRIGRNAFEVIGVVAVPAVKRADFVYLPYATAKSLFGNISLKLDTVNRSATQTEIGQIVFHLPDERHVADAAAVILRILDANHVKKDFAMTVPMELLRSKQKTQRILNLVLLAIAAISLVVGGIGIMNIMLANVTERIPEIGIRRALGARKKDIMLQFLTETVTLSTAGGILGCLLGVAAVPVISVWTDWPGVITPWAVAVSLAVSWLVGVVFGLAPAVRAARMDPVESLRYE